MSKAWNRHILGIGYFKSLKIQEMLQYFSIFPGIPRLAFPAIVCLHFTASNQEN